MLKFAHLADCHLGCWRNPELQELSVKAFDYAIDESIKEKVDFVLIAGDLFDTAMPPIEILKEAASKLKELKDNNIPCYVVAGSHDYSISGKTFLDVLENAGLFTNVARYSEDEHEVRLEIFKNNNLSLCGISGKKAGLEMKTIRKINHSNLNDNNLKILCLHTALTEAKPKGMEIMESVDADKLPSGFDYYALGHLHLYFSRNLNGKFCVYPGPLFPANFSEFEDLKCGSFCIAEWDGNINVKKKDVKLYEVSNLFVNADKKIPEQLTSEITNSLTDIKNSIVTLKIKGTLSRGRTSDIDFNRINDDALKNKNILLKNTSSLESPEFKAENEPEGKDIEEIERNLIEKYGMKEEYKDFSGKIVVLMHSLEAEKQEGEAKQTFEKRITEEISRIFGI